MDCHLLAILRSIVDIDPADVDPADVDPADPHAAAGGAVDVGSNVATKRQHRKDKRVANVFDYHDKLFPPHLLPFFHLLIGKSDCPQKKKRMKQKLFPAPRFRKVVRFQG